MRMEEWIMMKIMVLLQVVAGFGAHGQTVTEDLGVYVDGWLWIRDCMLLEQAKHRGASNANEWRPELLFYFISH